MANTLVLFISGTLVLYFSWEEFALIILISLIKEKVTGIILRFYCF